MATPYRTQNDVLASYRLRSHRAYSLGAGASAIVVLLLGFLFFTHQGSRSTVLWVVALPAAILPFYIAQRLPQYRVAGGAGELRLYRDRIEVPHPTSAEPMRMSLGELRVRVLTNALWINGVQVHQNHSLLLATPTAERVLATEIFASPRAVGRAANDIRRLQRGLEIGPRQDEAPRDEHEPRVARIDAVEHVDHVGHVDHVDHVDHHVDHVDHHVERELAGVAPR